MNAEMQRILNFEGPVVVEEVSGPPRIEDLLASQIEPTPTPDAFYESDENNKRKLTAFDRREGEITLNSAKIVAFLEYREDLPLVPANADPLRRRAILSDSNGEPYALVSNIECILPYADLDERDPQEDSGTAKQAFLYPVTNDLRVDQMSGRYVEEVIVVDGEGNRASLPHFALDSITQGGVTTECPDFRDDARDSLEEAKRRAQDAIGGVIEGADSAVDKLRRWWEER